MTEELSIVGKSIPLREGFSKVTGRERYAIDYVLPGSLWMKVLRSPHPHARIRSINLDKALALPGVKAALTHEDVPMKEALCKIFNWKGRILDNRVRFVGDEVAAIAAETEALAQEAVDLIEVDYEILPAVFDMHEAMKPGAPDVRGVGNNQVRCPPEPGFNQSHDSWGDIEKGFKEADVTIESNVETSQAYLTFCTPACIAEWNDDKLTLTMSHQCPHETRDSICDVLDIPEDKVRVVCPLLPVNFGLLNSGHRFYLIAALLAKKAGRPVTYKMTMEERGYYKSRESHVIRTRMGGTKDGTITAVDYFMLFDNGGYGFKGSPYQLMHDVFARSNVVVDMSAVCTNKFTTGCQRGVGDVPGSLAFSQAVDMLAEKLALDPLTLWKKNHHRAGDTAKAPGPTGFTLSSEAYDELLDRGSASIGWSQKWKGAGQPYLVDGPRRRGVGVGVGLHTSGVAILPAAATVQVNHDGTALVMIGFMDMGQGPKTTLAQVCAEVLGLKIDDTNVVKIVDTDTVPYAPMTGASITAHIGGSAVKLAAQDAKKQILEMAYTAPWSPETLKTGVSGPEELDIRDSMVFVKADPSRRATVKDIVGAIFAPMVIGRAGRHDIPFPGPTALFMVVTFADVEVDVETGKVTVLNIVHGQDAGQVINPQIAQNQVYGGVPLSFGYALMEEVAFDPATGRPLNPALSDYWMPSSLDVPPMEAFFADNIDPVGPMGIKGMGEGPAISPHGAITNAVYNATGKRLSHLPITPDKVLKALGKIE